MAQFDLFRLKSGQLVVDLQTDLIGTGPREPRRGAPYNFVTTDAFLNAFGLESLRDLPDQEQLADAGLLVGSDASAR